MQNIALSHQAQSEKHLLGVNSNSTNVDTYIPSELLQDFTEIDTQIFEDHTQMALVLEMSLESYHMLLVIGVGVVYLLQDLDLLHASFSPVESQ